MPSRFSWWRLAGLGGLVLLNVVLIALLVLRPTAPSAGERADGVQDLAPSATGAPEEMEEPPVKAEPSALPSLDDTVTPGPAERLLVNADASTAWRATTGNCTAPGTLERTVDGGATWEELPLDLAPVSRLRVLGPQSLFVIGGGEGCNPTYVSSSDGGMSWMTNDAYLVGSWYLLPGDSSVIATPVGEVDAPCEPAGLAALDAQHAAVLCAEASLALTRDGGASWSATEAQIEAGAIGVANDGYALAGMHEQCGDSVALDRVDTAGVALSEPACTELEHADAQRLAVSATGGAMWLWVEDEVAVVTDGGG